MTAARPDAKVVKQAIQWMLRLRESGMTRLYNQSAHNGAMLGSNTSKPGNG